VIDISDRSRRDAFGFGTMQRNERGGWAGCEVVAGQMLAVLCRRTTGKGCGINNS